MDTKQCFSWLPLGIFVLTVTIGHSSCSAIPHIEEPIIGFRITQGRDVTSDVKFPSQVSLQNIFGKHVCGGSILNSEYVITAAHCVAGDTLPDMIRVVTGTVDLSIPGHAYTVSRIIIHPHFTKMYSELNGERNVNDIALLKVASKFTLSGSEDSIKFPPPSRLLSGTGYVIGWGQMSDGRKPTMLQEATVQIIDDLECANHFGGTGSIIPETQVCAVGQGAGACRGDSGGPLFLDSTGEQVGVVSYGGLPCGAGPTVFTQLSAYRDWIAVTIGQTRFHSYSDDDDDDTSLTNTSYSLPPANDTSISANNDDNIVFL